MLSPKVIIGIAVSMIGASLSSAQDWSPSRPIQIIVPSQAGGPVDELARVIGKQLQSGWGQSVIIENRTGAGGNLAMQFVSQSAADGHILGTAHGGTHGSNASLYGARMPFDPVKDFTPLTLLAEMKNVLVVHPSLNVNSLNDLIALAKERPGKLTFGSSGTGTIQHLTGEMFKAAARVDLTHVPYRGQAQAMPDLLSGRISAMFLGAGAAAKHVQSGALVPIGLASKDRSSLLPEVAPLAEQGLVGFDAVTWFGLVAPARLPGNIVDAYYRKVDAILRNPELRRGLEANGIDPVPTTPSEFASFIQNEVKKWGAVVKSVGITAD